MTGVRFTRIARGYYPFPVWEFNLPAGFTCPYAAACLTWAEVEASGLPLDTDDTAAMSGPGNFALLDNFSADGRAAKRGR